MKILLSGGGTLGPVTPLIAIAKAYKNRHPFTEFIWVGTKHGPERRLVELEGFQFIAIPSGKFRRYFSFNNFLDFFRIFSAYLTSKKILKIEKPDLLITAGGFVSVPLHFAARGLGIPTWVHQQDVIAGLANRLMSKSASLITVSLEQSLRFFNKKICRWIGNPVRDLNGRDKRQSRAKFGIIDDEPLIFALGGGTGAEKLNKILLEALPLLPHNWHIIHLVGLERSNDKCKLLEKSFSNYQVYDFFTEEMGDAYAASDIVFARGGFGTLSELASLSKAAVILPISSSHQENNIAPFATNQAVLLMDESRDDGSVLSRHLKELANNKNKRELMGEKLHSMLPVTSDEIICSIIDELSSK